MLDLAAIRKELNLTQTELAEKLGVTQGTISRFESGNLPIDRRTALAVEALKKAAA
jgi:transcriptional regulator with XRE-family HTH domain